MIAALDLFCGAAGGWSLGLHRAGIRTVAACEIDPWRRTVFSANNPGVRMYDDVRSLTADRLLADLGSLPDWIVGSPPCQDASYANAGGRGVDGDRTGLFFEAIRLVGECRPTWVCFENVPGLRTRGADRVLAALEALGYACWPLVVGAVHAGAPHRRQRVWIVAHGPDANGESQHGSAINDEVARRMAGDVDSAGWRWPSGSGPDVARPGPSGGVAADAACGAGATIAPRLGAGGVQREAWGRPFVDDHDSDTNGAGLVQRKGVGGDALEELPPAIRAVAAGSGWNGGAPGIARSRRVVDGLSAGVDRNGITRTGAMSTFPPSARREAISSYGDAVLPQITEAIARSIISVSPPVPQVPAAEAMVGRSAPPIRQPLPRRP